MTWQPTHPQVELPELGFTVDEGLEELIRACWHRGIATFVSCIGDENEPGYLGFDDLAAAVRWDALTGHPVEWMGDEDVMTVAEVYFSPDEVPALAERLRFEQAL